MEIKTILIFPFNDHLNLYVGKDLILAFSGLRQKFLFIDSRSKELNNLLNIVKNTKPDLILSCRMNLPYIKEIKKISKTKIFLYDLDINRIDFLKELFPTYEYCDLILCNSWEMAKEYEKAGFKSKWLPVGVCTTRFYKPKGKIKQRLKFKADIVFCGSIDGHPNKQMRKKIVDILSKTDLNFKWFERVNYYLWKYLVNYWKINIGNNIGIGHMAGRDFKIMACGGFLLTNYKDPENESLGLKNNVHFVTYNEPEEIIEIADFILKNESFREKIKNQGFYEVRKNHSWAKRIEKILSLVEG
ncbi:MAG TPA: hypothetical protein ENG63_07015 [Candidatus Desulfofervidus auxilii]|uniref:Spore protein YkvP/CgeB glycosyl transferase-like domain-containing protein n=1 Tax=Desulfofervidus auxilii TaxID=1621989 RepID=A0A7C0Y9Z4_DESA2|nr:hypothetical protein [Candidatus Desulfofervidus auxilii]